MKFKLTDPTGFSDIGTVVYYKERPFYPEMSEVIDESTLRLESSSSNYMYSTSISPSEYTDFAKTGFSFNPKIKEDSLPNLYNYEDLTKISGFPYVDDLLSSAFPSISSNDYTETRHFFGKLTSPTETSYLIHLPKNIWKVEIYNSRLSEDLFIDYDVLTKLGEADLHEKPVLTIYFGPSYDVRIKNYTYSEVQSFPTYINRYINLEEKEYNNFEEVMSKNEYIESYREEILSEKIVYIVNTPSGEISSINYYSIAYPISKEPHPHMVESVLRNDDLWSEKLYISSTPTQDVLLDNRSGTLLGLKKLNESESSWLYGAIKLPENIYSTSSSSDDLFVNGKKWEKTVSTSVFGENPEISPYWYCPDYIPESKFKYFYIIKSQGKGNINPNGLVYLGPGKSLELEVNPEKGYEYSGISNIFPEETSISEDGKILIKTDRFNVGYRFEVKFKEIVYTLNLQIECLKDYPGNNGLSSTYNLENFIPEAELLYLSETGEIKKYDNSPLTISDTKELYFKLDFSNTYYNFSGNLKYGDGTKIPKINGWYVLRVSDFPDDIKKKIIPIGEITSKKYTVSIISTTGIQISTPKKNILEFHNMDPKSLTPSPRPFISKMILSEDNTIEIKKDNVIVNPGEDEDWTLTKGEDNVWTFEVPYIENNYEITIK